MARAVKEWIGKTDSTPAPPRVRDRIFERENGICHISGREIQPGELWEADHKIAIINGGENRESNLFPALKAPHKIKTKADVAEKKLIARKRKKHNGSIRSVGKIPSRGFTKYERERPPPRPSKAMERRSMFKDA